MILKYSNYPEIYKFAVTLLIFLVFSSGFSQNNDRTFDSYTFLNDTLTVKVNDGEYKIVYYSPEIVETSFIPTAEKFNKESFAVVLKPERVELTVHESETALTIDSEGLDITISKSPFQIKYFFNDEEVISEKAGYSKGKEHQKIEFNITAEEMLFGGGARALA
jgi:oligosaccharide 4-alpha-D-glucosyltransferase